MKHLKFCACYLSALVGLCSVSGAVTADAANTLSVQVDLSAERHAISPYIYGINDYAATGDVTVGSIRQGGNRYTAYNWETNASNAGSDWYHSSDTYLSSSTNPADCARQLSAMAAERGNLYTVATLQMCGYVAADINGKVTEEEAAPSTRWNAVVAKKNAVFADTPDLTDGTVYMDEYVNYLVRHLGDATTATGIKGYLLDNEPALWSSTHARIHATPVTCQELVDKSVELASAVKAVDPAAEIYGPALYGHQAYVNLQSATDWGTVGNGYDWFISYYLDQMRKASETQGVRLLDVLDIHNYSEAQGDCRIVNCDDASHTACQETRMQAVRTFWDSSYAENSWVGQWGKSYLPYLPKIQDSIDRYYPGTKISLSEYSFGGGNTISGAVAQADALGVFGVQEVYLATLWPYEDCPFQKAAINLYTNYDGAGSAFGDTSIPCTVSNIEAGYAYAATDVGSNDATVQVVVSNKSMTDSRTTEITLTGTNISYENVKVYGITEAASEVVAMDSCVISLENNVLTLNLPAASVVQVELNGDAAPLYGDLDEDGVVTVGDAVMANRYIAESLDTPLTDAAMRNADCNLDGIITSADVSALMRYIANLGTLPIETV